MDNNEVITSVSCKDCGREIVDPVVSRNFFFGSHIQDTCLTCIFTQRYSKKHLVRKPFKTPDLRFSKDGTVSDMTLFRFQEMRSKY